MGSPWDLDVLFLQEWNKIPAENVQQEFLILIVCNTQ